MSLRSLWLEGTSRADIESADACAKAEGTSRAKWIANAVRLQNEAFSQPDFHFDPYPKAAPEDAYGVTQAKIDSTIYDAAFEIAATLNIPVSEYARSAIRKALPAKLGKDHARMKAAHTAARKHIKRKSRQWTRGPESAPSEWRKISIRISEDTYREFEQLAVELQITQQALGHRALTYILGAHSNGRILDGQALITAHQEHTPVRRNKASSDLPVRELLREELRALVLESLRGN